MPLALEQVVRKRGAGRHRLHHLAADDAFRLARIFHLFADRDPVSLLDEPPEIFGERLHGHAGQRHFRRAAVVPRRQREAEFPRRDLGVVVEHLVEVAHPEHEDGVGVLRLDLLVLLHQRRRLAAHGRSASTTMPLTLAARIRPNAATASARVG